MVVKEEQERVRTLISDTVTLLCRNGLSYKTKFCINALIGITLDEDEVMLVDIRETVKNIGAEESDSDDATSNVPPPRKRKKHKRHHGNGNNDHADSGSDGEGRLSTAEGYDEDTNEPPHKRTVKEEDNEDSGDDLVFIKDEPADTPNMSAPQFDSSLYHQQQQQGSDILGSLAQQGQLYATPAASESLPGPAQWDPTASQVPFSQSSLMSPSTPSSSQRMSSGPGDTSSQVGLFSILKCMNMFI